ncbi:MAG: enoyl-CoA hydratase/isomerase family protein [Desulfobacteraceae bacterium]|nr:enoyl-CoA hydratase/isomerase family protein [Desulfobacteraceae bacterium]
MSFVHVSKTGEIATVTLSRGKVNALNEPMLREIRTSFQDLEKSDEVRAVILTGRGKFFSFGFDIPELLSYSKDDFIRYLTTFANFCSYLFLFPKPVIAALNGHTIAGGCMLANACDLRVMVSEKAKIALNEITFGASVFAGSVAILKFCVGSRNAETILYSGTMYSPDEAARLGLVDQIVPAENLMQAAEKAAVDFASKSAAAFSSIKGLLRGPIAEEMAKREQDSLHEFADIWYSEETWAKLQDIKIHS